MDHTVEKRKERQERKKKKQNYNAIINLNYATGVDTYGLTNVTIQPLRGTKESKGIITSLYNGLHISLVNRKQRHRFQECVYK